MLLSRRNKHNVAGFQNLLIVAGQTHADRTAENDMKSRAATQARSPLSLAMHVHVLGSGQVNVVKNVAESVHKAQQLVIVGQKDCDFSD